MSVLSLCLKLVEFQRVMWWVQLGTQPMKVRHVSWFNKRSASDLIKTSACSPAVLFGTFSELVNQIYSCRLRNSSVELDPIGVNTQLCSLRFNACIWRTRSCLKLSFCHIIYTLFFQFLFFTVKTEKLALLRLSVINGLSENWNPWPGPPAVK